MAADGPAQPDPEKKGVVWVNIEAMQRLFKGRGAVRNRKLGLAMTAVMAIAMKLDPDHGKPFAADNATIRGWLEAHHREAFTDDQLRHALALVLRNRPNGQRMLNTDLFTAMDPYAHDGEPE